MIMIVATGIVLAASVPVPMACAARVPAAHARVNVRGICIANRPNANPNVRRVTIAVKTIIACPIIVAVGSVSSGNQWIISFYHHERFSENRRQVVCLRQNRN